MAERKRTRTVYRLAPCPWHHVEKTESWLGDMAREGLFLEPKGFTWWGGARFYRGEPCEVRYRLASTQGKDVKWIDFLGNGPWTAAPEQNDLEFFRQFGWEYVGPCGRLFVYRAENEEVRELDSDPCVQAIGIREVRNLELYSIISLAVILAIDYLLFFDETVFWWMACGLTPYWLVLSLPLLGLFLRYTFQAISMEGLRRKLSRGIPLDHQRPWRRGAWWNYVKKACICLTGLLVVVVFVYVFLADNLETPSTHYTPEEYPDDPPFATVADLAPAGEYRVNRASFVSGVTELESDWIPVSISWNEKADICLSDGQVYTASLCADYQETRWTWIAQGLVRDYRVMDKSLVNNVWSEYEILDLPELDVDYALAYTNTWGEPTLLIRNGTKVLHASFQQTGVGTLSLEEWTIQMSEAIQ
ncbi:MAG: DUF2812 domain-containing protein [Ruminiclostridium sp.]|nr:DUF2812 domain-containing protein [Ruminiclostridium sp.]